MGRGAFIVEVMVGCNLVGVVGCDGVWKVVFGREWGRREGVGLTRFDPGINTQGVGFVLWTGPEEMVWAWEV